MHQQTSETFDRNAREALEDVQLRGALRNLATTLFTFTSPMPVEMSGTLTEKVPPKPQHSSSSAKSSICSPAT